MNIAVWKIIATAILAIFGIFLTKLLDPLAKYVGYGFNLLELAEDLEEEVERLLEIQRDLLRLDPSPSSDTCRGWVRRVQGMCCKAEDFRTRVDGGGLSYLNKCELGKQADTKLKKAKGLVGEGGGLLEEAQAMPRPRSVHAASCLPQKQPWGMGSYKQKVLDFIQDDSISTHQSGLLGIWGMVGVGKTSLLKFARDFPFELKSTVLRGSSGSGDHAPFDHVLFVQAGTESTVGKIQKAIADCMGLHVATDGTPPQESTIRNHLLDKSFLLLIDDLWEYHNLEDVGIPMPLGTVQRLPLGGGVVQKYWRKVVFTTRSEDVCVEMGCAEKNLPVSNSGYKPGRLIRLQCLSKDDAWKLFIDKVGNEIINDSQLEDLATQLVDECSGLPAALCTIGQAMSTKKDPKEWRCAIDLLKDSKLLELKMNNELTNSLKLSYDHMGDDLKKCFLISLLWPRGENIPKKKLVAWWTGLGLLDVSNAINRGCWIINSLIGASMLEKGDTNLYSSENSHVKMHEVTREMALWIVKDRLLPLSFCRSALPEEKWRTVQEAWISVVDSSDWTPSVSCPKLTMLVSRHAFSFKASPCFQSITYLDLEGTKMHRFPLEICSLGTLRCLNLSATTIDALPKDLQKLSNLKYLYIRDIGTLQTVPNELVSQLTKLRVLDLFRSGSISTSEDHYFSSLTEGFPRKGIDLTLGITVRTQEDIMKLMRLKNKGVRTQALCMHHFEGENRRHNINLELLSHMETLRELTVTNSPDIVQLIVKGLGYDKHGLVPNLEFLELSNLHKLQEVTWKNAGLDIRVIVIYNCTKLRHVTWVQCLQRLEELTITYCPELEKVIDDINNDNMVVANQQVKSFGKLKKLYLEELPKLSIISEHSYPFEELSYVFVARCKNLKIIRVQERSKQHKINIDCCEDWWTSLGEDHQRVMNAHFVPPFCLQQRIPPVAPEITGQASEAEPTDMTAGKTSETTFETYPETDPIAMIPGQMLGATIETRQVRETQQRTRTRRHSY